MPLQENDPRRRNKGHQAAKPASGSIKGVGWKLKGPVEGINMDVHPTGDMTLEESKGAQVTVEQMSKRWTNYGPGTGEHSSFYADVLRELRAAQKIPGLSPEDHAKYGLEPTAEQVYDFAHSEDKELLAAWHQLSGTKDQFNPGDVGLEPRVSQLEGRVKALELRNPSVR